MTHEQIIFAVASSLMLSGLALIGAALERALA